MINQLQKIFHSIIKSLEVLHVTEGIKPCARMMVFEDELNKTADFLNQNNLSWAVSDFKAVKQSLQSEFYSDKSIKIQKNDARKGYFFLYLSKNRETAEKARQAEEKSSHKELGLLLGYPECCCDFFGKNFNEKSTDITLRILENSSGFEFPFYTNIAARHFDVSLLSHFPHSFDCRLSAEIAENNLIMLNKHSPQLASLFEDILKSAVVYTSEEGIFLLRKCKKIGNEVIYGDVLTTAKNKLYYLISSNKKLKITDKHSFAINEVSITGEKYGVMVFD